MRFFVILFLMLAATVPMESQANSQDFSSWLQQLRSEARQRGISEGIITQGLPSSMQPLPRVLELDRKQPESTRTFDQYLTMAVNDKRVRDGQSRMTQHHSLLQRVSDTYGVPPEVIVALWGVETSYGSNTGGFSVVQALATLAYDGRRSAFFREELLKALEIADADHIRLADMRGSWAGAMGQCQFMPSSFLRFAQDFNNDGKRDIWNTEADVFASTANYLSKSGWKKNQPWGMRVKLPEGIDRSLLGIDTAKSIQFWHDLGVRQANGKSLPFEGAYFVSVIQPGGAGTSAFVVYDNYKVIMKWNKSNYFATSVGLLSDRLKGW